jgi:hypothetical protein
MIKAAAAIAIITVVGTFGMLGYVAKKLLDEDAAEAQRRHERLFKN